MKHMVAALSPRIVRFLMLAAVIATLSVTELRAQSGVIESWRDSAGNWTGRRHALDSAGNLLVLGDTVVGDIIQVRKYTSSGQLLWSSIYDPVERVVSYWIATDAAGNAWVAAARITGSQNSRVGFLVLKYDPQGNLLFVDVTSGGMAVRVVTDFAGNAYVVGNGWTGAGTIGENYMVVKYAPNGTRLWTGFMENGSTTFLARPQSLALSPDQTRLVVAGGGFTATWHALSVALFDTTTGQRLWNALDTSLYGANDVAFAPDGASVVAGNTGFTLTGPVMSLHRFDVAGNRIFSRSYAEGTALLRLAVDGDGNVVATGTASPLAGSAYRDWMTIKTDTAGVLQWARRYDASRNNDEVPGWVTVDGAGSVYVAGMGGPSPSIGNVSFLKPVTLKYDAAGTPVWATFNGGDVQVTTNAAGSVFTLYSGQMTSARFEQTGTSDPVPATPTQLSAAGSFGGIDFSVDLAWTDNAVNEFWYAIERCPGAGCTGFVEIGRTRGENSSSFRDAPLPSGATFTYRVRAIGFAGNSTYSNTATATTPLINPPAAPSNLAAALSGSSVQLTWTDNSTDETQFAIERCNGTGCSAFAQISAVGANVTSYLDTAIVAGQSYSYRVRAWNSGGGYSAYSNVATAATQAIVPSAPSNLAASSTRRRRIDLTWSNTASDATSISVERCSESTCSNFGIVAVIAATATSWTDSGLSSGTTYRYRVRASNAAGSSPYSDIASAQAR